MQEVVNFGLGQRFDQMKPALYVFRSNGEKKEYHRHHTFGVAGVVRNADGNLQKRMNVHNKTKPALDFLEKRSKTPRHEFYHFGDFVWAADLAGWTPLSGKLAEKCLEAAIAMTFRLVDTSVFISTSRDDVLTLCASVYGDLVRIADAKNSRLERQQESANMS
jgi:hypothetical protein